MSNLNDTKRIIKTLKRNVAVIAICLMDLMSFTSFGDTNTNLTYSNFRYDSNPNFDSLEGSEWN